MPHVLTLTGASGSGKSLVVQRMLRLHDVSFQPVLVPKFTTRSQRPEDQDSTRPREVVCVTEMPCACDLIYEQYGERYGLRFQDLYEQLQCGKTPIVILNDIRAVEDVKTACGALVKSIFVFRASPSIESYRLLTLGRGDADPDEYLKRYQKANAIYRIYIENIALFNHIILNCGDMDELDLQIKQIICGLADNPRWQLSGGS